MNGWFDTIVSLRALVMLVLSVVLSAVLGCRLEIAFLILIYMELADIADRQKGWKT